MRREATKPLLAVSAVCFVVAALCRCVTSGNLPTSTPRPDATPDAQWIPVVDPGFDAGAGGR